jgi:hypothetical protein
MLSVFLHLFFQDFLSMRALFYVTAIAATLFTRHIEAARTHYVHSSCTAREHWKSNYAMWQDMVKAARDLTRTDNVPKDIDDAAYDIFKIKSTTDKDKWKKLRGMVVGLYVLVERLTWSRFVCRNGVMGSGQPKPQRRIRNAQSIRDTFHLQQHTM